MCSVQQLLREAAVKGASTLCLGPAPEPLGPNRRLPFRVVPEKVRMASDSHEGTCVIRLGILIALAAHSVRSSSSAGSLWTAVGFDLMPSSSCTEGVLKSRCLAADAAQKRAPQSPQSYRHAVTSGWITTILLSLARKCTTPRKPIVVILKTLGARRLGHSMASRSADAVYDEQGGSC